MNVEIKPDIKWLDDPEVFSVNQIPAHSDHAFYEKEEDYRSGRKGWKQSLNGAWRFCYSENAMNRPAEFYKEDYDSSYFDVIQVPGHIELAGYDKIHYINTMYPWEGHIFRRPAYSIGEGAGIGDSFSQASYNPVGSYVREFDLDSELCNKRVSVCFEGVEEAMYLWINGHFVGYAEDSFTPSEFDLTPYIRKKKNIMAVEVYKRSTAAFLEDQDFFRFFGIFRDVSLYARPILHVEDMWAKCELLKDNKSGSFSLDLKISADCNRIENEAAFAGRTTVVLLDQNQKEVLKKEISFVQNAAEREKDSTLLKVHMEPQDVGEVIPWDHHTPYLYELKIFLYDEQDQLVEFVPYRIGFSRIEIQDKIILFNGKRLIINGINRHEWNAESGRCISRKEMQFDIDLFLKNNINAVRTSHYPNQIPWYYLCDENGIYVMAETNLESHGSWQKMGAVEPSWNVPGSLPEWKGAVLERARNNFETFKNHTSILFWSLGNESYAGDNLAEMNRYFKEKDPGRLVHYEGVFQNRSYEDKISDVESRMYASPAEVEAYLLDNPKKPFILCEYMHDMGNSLGGMKTYIDLIDRYEMYQGGFIWDYIDQALLVEDEVTGERVLRYGGDFDDRPSDYEFSANGIVFADRTEKPALQEVKYYYGLHK